MPTPTQNCGGPTSQILGRKESGQTHVMCFFWFHDQENHDLKFLAWCDTISKILDHCSEAIGEHKALHYHLCMLVYWIDPL